MSEPTVRANHGGGRIPLVLSDEALQLRDAVRRFLGEAGSVVATRALIEGQRAHDERVWHRMATELGLLGIMIPEAHGGAGASAIELGVICEELGRAVTMSPYFATVVLAATAIMEADDAAAAADLLPGIAAGDTIATFAIAGESDRWDETGVLVDVDQRGSGPRLSGTRSFVPHGMQADLVLVLGAGADGPTLFAVDADAPGLTRRPLEVLDLTRPLAEVTFAATPARPIGRPGDGWTTLAATLDVAAVALAAESAGGAARCLELSADYARERVQFGRVIGSFQAIKHLCADMVVAVEGAKAAAAYAAWASAERWPDRKAAAAIAKVYCTEAYTAVAAETIQVHGGIGFTWEHDAHLHFRRAKAGELMLGHDYHRRSLEERVGLPANGAAR